MRIIDRNPRQGCEGITGDSASLSSGPELRSVGHRAWRRHPPAEGHRLAEEDVRSEFELTMPPHDLMEVLQRLRGRGPALTADTP